MQKTLFIQKTKPIFHKKKTLQKIFKIEKSRKKCFFRKDLLKFLYFLKFYTCHIPKVCRISVYLQNIWRRFLYNSYIFKELVGSLSIRQHTNLKIRQEIQEKRLHTSLQCGRLEYNQGQQIWNPHLKHIYIKLQALHRPDIQPEKQF